MKTLTLTVKREISFEELLRQKAELVDRYVSLRERDYVLAAFKFVLVVGVLLLACTILVAGLSIWLPSQSTILSVALTLSVILAVVVNGVTMVRLRRNAQVKAEQHPLYVRGKLIQETAAIFYAQCNRYEVWRKAVEQGLVPEDGAAAARCYDVILHAGSVIEGAIDHFIRAWRLEGYMTSHPVSNITSETGSVESSDRTMNALPRSMCGDFRDALGSEYELRSIMEDLCEVVFGKFPQDVSVREREGSAVDTSVRSATM